jgi:hypothetical protein
MITASAEHGSVFVRICKVTRPRAHFDMLLLYSSIPDCLNIHIFRQCETSSKLSLTEIAQMCLNEIHLSNFILSLCARYTFNTISIIILVKEKVKITISPTLNDGHFDV